MILVCGPSENGCGGDGKRHATGTADTQICGLPVAAGKDVCMAVHQIGWLGSGDAEAVS